MPSFHIYKSSAGSGKTSQLVFSYLKLCLGSENVTYYRKILAITFTKKASNEMRERLIKELQTLSTLREDEAPDYMTENLLKELKLDIDTLRKRAKAVFKDLLQAYEQVSISTIDKFNHTLIKSFSRDLDIPADFEVDTNEKEIFREAVSELISRVGIDEHITKHLINYVQYKLDEDSKVRVEQALENLFGLCIGESSYSALDEIGQIEKEKFEEISKGLQNDIRKLETKIKLLGKKALDLIHSAQLSVSDLSYGKNGVYGFFQKVKEQNPVDLELSARAKNALDGVWMPKKVSTAKLAAFTTIEKDLHQILLEIQKFLEEDLSSLIFKQAIRSNIDLIAVLTALSETFRELCERKKIIPISRFNKLISDALRKEPVSFIYEQIGARFNHILIDEFQDTSQLQWYNLLPLIDESIARGNFNMVVGDAKQSIYRWRGGKAEQLIDLPDLFEPPADILPETGLNLKANSTIARLDINYRSLDKIVEFNNELIARLCQQAVSPDSIYASEYNPESFTQKYTRQNKGGYIELNELSENDEKGNWSELLRQIAFCRENGYEYGDMAILVRSAKNEGKSITRTLLEKNIPVVSKESYNITEYQTVKIILAFLKLSLDPNHNPSKIQVVKGLGNLRNTRVEYGEYIAKKHLDLDSFLKENGLKDFESYNCLSIYDAIEQIHADYLSDVNHPAINSLKESTFSRFGLRGSLYEFFEYWESLNEKPAIQFGDRGNSIELLTIHKAKGLQYKVVLIPSLAWKLRTNNKELAWFNLKNHPIELPYAPLTINKSLPKMGLEREYTIEENANRFDNLNLVYVAVTRAEEAVFINTYDNNNESVGKWMINAIEAIFDNPTHLNSLATIEQTDIGRKISIGKMAEISQITHAEAELDAQTPILAIKPWKSYLDFAHVVENREQKLGNIFHELISETTNYEAFNMRLERKRITGELNEEEMNRLIQYSANLFSDKTFSGFLKSGKILAEREIFFCGKTLRPDMVILKEHEQIVLDFKTGGNSEKHNAQLGEYVEACNALDKRTSRGYIVYLDPFQMVPLNAKENPYNGQTSLF